MRETYVWRDGHWRDDNGNPMDCPNRIAMPMIQSDTPDYISPVNGKLISGRRARRYDLESNGCREVDPSEGPKYCTSKKWAKKLGMEWNDDPGAGRPKHWNKDFSSTRK